MAERRARGFTVNIPPPRDEGLSSYFMAVRGDVVYQTIDVLRCCIAQWRPPEGLDPADQAASSLMAATCSALGGLMEAHEAHQRLHGAPELLDQIQDFVAAPAEGVAGTGGQAEFIEAVLALAHKERDP